MAEFLKTWLPIVSTALGIIITAISFLIPYIKNAKAKKILETAVKIAEAVKPYIVEAEKFTHYTGEEKFNFVITKANQYAIDNKLKFDYEAVSKEIESNVALSKQVNQREKDKITVESAEVQPVA